MAFSGYRVERDDGRAELASPWFEAWGKVRTNFEPTPMSLHLTRVELDLGLHVSASAWVEGVEAGTMTPVRAQIMNDAGRERLEALAEYLPNGSPMILQLTGFRVPGSTVDQVCAAECDLQAVLPDKYTRGITERAGLFESGDIVRVGKVHEDPAGRTTMRVRDEHGSWIVLSGSPAIDDLKGRLAQGGVVKIAFEGHARPIVVDGKIVEEYAVDRLLPVRGQAIGYAASAPEKAPSHVASDIRRASGIER